MTDIVERLRAEAPPSGGCGLVYGDLVREAADEIERLEAEINQRTIAAAERREQLFAEIERLRALLSGYVNAYRDKRGITYEMEQDARRALEGK